MVLISSPDGTNVCASRDEEYEGIGSVYVENGKIVLLGGHFLFTCSDILLYRMYRLATMHSVTDGQTIVPMQYDRLKSIA